MKMCIVQKIDTSCSSAGHQRS